MFGDDPDPTVTIVRSGFGEVFGRALEGAASWQERLGGHGQGEAKTRLGSDRSTKATEISEERQLRADASFKNNDGNKVPMQCG